MSSESMSMCSVCGGHCESHHCSSCKKLCHPFCGKGGEEEEGYGGEVICFPCLAKEKVDVEKGKHFRNLFQVFLIAIFTKGCITIPKKLRYLQCFPCKRNT